MLDFKRPSGSDPSMPDMTPMIDCVFQLLVFFLLASSFAKASAVILELPKGQATNPPDSGPLVVAVDKVGNIFVQEEPVALESITAKVVQELKGLPSRSVELRADKSLPYERILEVMVRLEQAGAEQVNLSYEHK
jgi:biopolymer transport protein ExbD